MTVSSGAPATRIENKSKLAQWVIPIRRGLFLFFGRFGAQDQNLAGQRHPSTVEAVSVRVDFACGRPQVRPLHALYLNPKLVICDDSEGTSLDALRQIGSPGIGVTLLPALYVHSEVNKALGDVAGVDLTPESQQQIGLVWRASSCGPSAYRRLAGLTRDVA